MKAKLVIANFARDILLRVITHTVYGVSLGQRANYTEVGFTGNVSEIDKLLAQEKKLRPLNRFEKWLLTPVITYERNLRRESFRQSCIQVLGEDPETDW